MLKGNKIYVKDGVPKVYINDPDALRYIAAVQAADQQSLEPAVRKAITDFIVGCKLDGIWSAIKASCILCGARTLSGALTPLVGSAPTNNNFVSGDYNRETGLGQGGNVNKWLNSNYLNNADSRQNNNHQLLFLSSADTGLVLGDFFGFSGHTNITSINHRNMNQTNGNWSATFPNAVGHARSQSDSYSGIIGSVVSTYAIASQSPTDIALGLFRATSGGTAFASANSRLAFYSIGNSLSLSQLSSRISALYTAIGAAIP
jgi:hypothetical protein